MSLTERIAQLRKDISEANKAVKEARRELWDANYVRKNDARRKGESDEHWHKRRRRNRERYEHRKDVVKHLTAKRQAMQKELDELVEHRKEIKEAAQKAKLDKDGTDIVAFDGKSVVEKAAYWCDRARREGRWHGIVVSGYRTPAYSTSLCYAMCGAASCPGKCAGASSNHAKTTYPGPAVDVSDYNAFENAMASYGNPLWNDLPLDPVHFSASGH